MNEEPRHEQGLFDLPFEAPPPPLEDDPPAKRVHRSRSSPRSETLPLFDGASPNDTGTTPRRVARPRAAPRGESATSLAASIVPQIGTTRRAAPIATLGPRLRASVGDLLMLAATAALAAVGAGALGAPLTPATLLPLGLFVLSWSFVYFVIPLAFWGQTPGMSWAGVVARTEEEEPLAFGQTVRRWLGTWLTWATFGLPGLLALGGRSLCDRLSGSRTLTSGSVAAQPSSG